MTTIKTTCTKCGLPIHQELVRPLHEKIRMEFIHDDSNEAWCRKDGYAYNLHFAEPIGEVILSEEVVQSTNQQ